MQFIIILLLVLLNGLLAMSEIAVVSARRARLQQRAHQGSSGAQAALELAENPTRFLSTVQIGITLVGVVAGAFGGATVGGQLGDWLAERIPALAPYSESIGIGAVVALTTYLSLVIGELVPKRLAIQYPEAIASAVAVPMRRVSQVVAPVVWFLSASTGLVLRLLRIDPEDETPPTDAEIVHMIQEGTDEGAFDVEEVRMVRGVLRLDDKRISSIMTPRTSIAALRLDVPIGELKQQIISTPHSYYPVFGADSDNVVGIIKAKDLLQPLVNGEEIDLQALMRPALFVPGLATASSALEMFKSSRNEMAVVVDEHGGIDGILTLNDVIEEIVGDVDAEDPEIVRREDGSLLIDGNVPLERLNEHLPTRLDLPEEEVGSYETIAGFVMARLGRLPKSGDVFTYERLRVEVMDMDGARVDKVLVSERATEPDA